MQIEETRIEANGLVFDALAAGPAAGTPVLMLHGFPQTSAGYRPQLKALGEAGYRVVAPNQRGYSSGARPDGVAEYTLDNLGADVAAMADALGFGKFHLVGHDWGAAVAWYVGVHYRERILTLNPISVPHPDAFARVLRDSGSDQRERSGYMEFLRSEGSEEALVANDGAVLRNIYSGIDRATQDAYIAVLGTKEAMRAAVNWYRAIDLGGVSPLGAVDVPTMFIWSDQDHALGPDGAKLTAQFVSGPYRFEVLKGIDHWIPDKAPQRLSALLLDAFGAAA